MLDFDEPTVEFDFLEVEVEVDSDAIDQNRNYEMKRPSRLVVLPRWPLLGMGHQLRVR